MKKLFSICKKDCSYIDTIMPKRYQKALFIFRRDLRLEDNTALHAAFGMASQVTACFIFDPRQLKKNKYLSNNALQFMIESLWELDREIQKRGGRLFYFFGIVDDVINDLLEEHEALFINADYTPFSIKRDRALASICSELDCDFHSYDDALLTSPGSVLKNDNSPYTVFTYFCKAAQKQDVAKPKRGKDFSFSNEVSGYEENEQIIDELITKTNPKLAINGGRSAGTKLLRKIKTLENYEQERDFPALKSTSKLSAHNKFGTLSIREVYHYIVKHLGANHLLIRQLYWRDFFTHIAFHFPHVFNGSFHEKYDALNWNNSRADFNAWCKGQTGFPIVDAGMRQLNTTGYMHNRVRMIVASFLVKDLHINWRSGEKYFAQQLVDYDPSVNNGNWQWAASTGCDAQPYFRIFNPWLQQKKFDPDAKYIKTWLPELKDLSVKEIHRRQIAKEALNDYPAPMVNHSEEKEWAEERFASVNK